MAKRVGIITYHRADNFGAVLQCYALQETLRILGYDTRVIDYRQSFTELIYSPWRLDILKKGLGAPRLLGGYLLKELPTLYKRHQLYNQFRKKHLHCSKPIKRALDMPQDIDVYLIGSDQMWSLHPTNEIIEPVFFGDFPKPTGSSIQGYAISSNFKSLQTIGKDYLKKATDRFERLSFREAIISDEVERMTGRHGEVALDPSLLLDYTEWDNLTTGPIIKEPYLLTYFLSDDTDNLEFRDQVRDFGKLHGLKVVDMFEIAYSPIDFLNAMKYATVVLTSSFHAMAFSILFRKTFYAFRSTDGRDIRYINLLNSLNIEDRLITTGDINTLGITGLDYSKINGNLEKLRQNSLNYLKAL